MLVLLQHVGGVGRVEQRGGQLARCRGGEVDIAVVRVDRNVSLEATVRLSRSPDRDSAPAASWRGHVGHR